MQVYLTAEFILLKHASWLGEIVSDITPGSGMRLIAEVQPKTAGRDSCDFLLH